MELQSADRNNKIMAPQIAFIKLFEESKSNSAWSINYMTAQNENLTMQKLAIPFSRLAGLVGLTSVITIVQVKSIHICKGYRTSPWVIPQDLLCHERSCQTWNNSEKVFFAEIVTVVVPVKMVKGLGLGIQRHTKSEGYQNIIYKK